MKFVIVFFLLFSVSYGYGQSAQTEAVSPQSLSPEEGLVLLRSQLKRYVDSLMLVLLNKDTPRENQMEILNEIRSIADTNGQITIALNQISQSDIGENEVNTHAGKGRDEELSVWVKSQAELIRRKELAFNELQKRETELDEDFWVNLGLDGLVIIAGGVLFFVPAVGPAVSIPLTAGRITLTGQRLGALLMGIGSFESGLDVWSSLFGEEERILSFVSDIAFRDVLTQELFNILSSTNPEDRYLAIEFLKSATDEKALTSDLLNAIKDEQRTAELRGPALRALRAVSDMDEDLRSEAIETLKKVVDESQIPSLRETALRVLGELGEGRDELAVYLEDIGYDVQEKDKLRLIALIELGRNKDYFPFSVHELAKWLKERDYEKFPLNIQPDISDTFLDSLLLVNKRELSENHITVVKEFILSGILPLELKIRFSETLLKWDNSPKTREFLRKAYSKPAQDFSLYTERDLFKEGLSEKNYGAFQFLTRQTKILENTDNTEIILPKIESLIKELKRGYPSQIEKTKKLEEIVNSYKKTLENIKN